MNGRSNRFFRKGRCMAILCMICTLIAAAGVAGAERRVVINGKEVAGAELEKLDRADCRSIPDGNYWLNRRSGTWGYTGDRVAQGRIGDGCRVFKRAVPKSRSIDPAGSDAPNSGSAPDEVIQREEPITGTSPLLRAPGSEPENP